MIEIIFGDLVHAEELTELGNGKRFAEIFNEDMLYVSEYKKWVQLEEVWTVNSDGAAIRNFETVLDELKREMIMFQDAYNEFIGTNPEPEGVVKQTIKAGGDELRGFKSWIKSSQSLKVINSSITLAQSRKGMTVSVLDFDKDPYVLGTTNAVIDLKTGKAVEGKRPLILKNTTCDYNQFARCDKWQAFLKKIMLGDMEKVDYLQRVVGQSMLGIKKDKFIVLTGSGGNGKSVFVDTINEVLGGYADVANPDILTTNNRINKEYHLVNLRGARMVIMAETEDGDRIDANFLKQLVDSGDTTARKPAGEPFTFQPTATTYTKHKPPAIVR